VDFADPQDRETRKLLPRVFWFGCRRVSTKPRLLLASPNTESTMSLMTERRTTRRYDLTLPISIRAAAERVIDRQFGRTRDISTRGLFFVIDQDMEAGSELDITLTLPAEITNGTDVFVRAQGKVVRVERRIEEGEPRMGVAAIIERYDIIRGESGKA
jgi:c-di-GMP-binding flagellar brake protein YcgR